MSNFTNEELAVAFEKCLKDNRISRNNALYFLGDMMILGPEKDTIFQEKFFPPIVVDNHLNTKRLLSRLGLKYARGGEYFPDSKSFPPIHPGKEEKEFKLITSKVSVHTGAALGKMQLDGWDPASLIDGLRFLECYKEELKGAVVCLGQSLVDHYGARRVWVISGVLDHTNYFMYWGEGVGFLACRSIEKKK